MILKSALRRNKTALSKYGRPEQSKKNYSYTYICNREEKIRNDAFNKQSKQKRKKQFSNDGNMRYTKQHLIC